MSRGCSYLDKVNSSSYYDNTLHMNGGKFKKQNVEALALHLWKFNVIFTIRDRYQNKLFYQVFEWIRQARDQAAASSSSSPHTTIRAVVTSLVQVNSFTDQPLQLYIEEFERPYLVHTKRYYESEAAREMASGDISHFMHKAHDRLEQEITRNYQYYIIIEQFERMLKEERFEDCTLVYQLLNRLPNGDGLKPILVIYENYVAKLGREIVARIGSGALILKNPRAYVDQLLQLHAKYYQVNQQVFCAEPLFTAAVDKAFRTVINEGNNISSSGTGDINSTASVYGPETLARYCDLMLKKNAGKRDMSTAHLNDNNSGNKRNKGLKKLIMEVNEGDQEEKLMKMVTLFKYVDDKDIFQKFYSRMLAKRLIYNASSSEELEMNMINKLKEICGIEYTSKLNKMFTDMSLSSDLNVKFKTYIKEKNKEILVLTAGAWPLNQKEDGGLDTNKLQMPRVLESMITSFESFYGSQYNGRRLLWQWNLTRGEIRLNHLDKNYELQVSLYQMIILLLFNLPNNKDQRHHQQQQQAQDSISLSIQDIVNQSGLSLADILKSIRPLIDMNVLQLTEGGDQLPTSKKNIPKLSESTAITVNTSFTSKRTKIKVPASSTGTNNTGNNTSQSEAEKESQAARKLVDEDRRMYVQATIVRVMKSRQKLSHLQLVQEVLDQANTRFQPSVTMIKKCIEQLLEKQFIAREDRDTYVYVA
ncbi:Cullin [Mycotypha africana]|uniref:Cullin n=1 Tax=Mycotypha africana TaxID=64632 RepID=UPI0023013F4E|nr:Cullin [Mycotypha africana]KAI8975525.1 Cullin [Mycotypha africana]